MLAARAEPKWGMEVEAQRLWHQSLSCAWREVGDASGGGSSPVLVQSLLLWEKTQPGHGEVSSVSPTGKPSAVSVPGSSVTSRNSPQKWLS